MNILVVAHYHYQGFSVPTALFVHEQMKAYVAEGHRVRILVPTPIGKKGEDGHRLFPAVWREDVDGIEHVYLRFASFSSYGSRGLNSASSILALKLNFNRIFGDFTPDVIHAHKLGPNTDLAAVLRERFNCPLVFTSHGETNCEEPWLSEPERIRKTAEKADHVVCVSRLLEKGLQDAGVKTPMSVIYNGFNVHYVLEQQEKAPVSLVQVGHLLRQKKQDVSIRAFAKLREKYPDAKFEIVGPGPELGQLQALCQKLSVGEAVHFRGSLTNQKTLEVMAGSRFFVMPSVREGFGIVYLEAMASGCVTIGTEGEGISGVIVSGENGFLVPADDPEAIVRIVDWCIQHPKEAAAIADKGRETALKFTWENNAQQYIRLFNEIGNNRERLGQI